MCTFSVENVVCDNRIGRSSHPAVVTLQGRLGRVKIYVILEYVTIETDVTLKFIECTHGELIL